MRNIDFGGHVTTTRTVWRKPRDRFEPQFHIQDDIHTALAKIEDAERELGFLRADSHVGRKIQEITLEENVFASLRLAGIEVTLDEVRTALARRPAMRHDEPARFRQMQNLAAYEDDLAERRVPLRVADVATEHAALFHGVDGEAGRIRERDTFDAENGSEVGFVPAAPERIRTELQNLLDWLAASDDPAAVRAGVFMHEFMSLRPFVRGNGMLARLIAKVILYRGGCDAVPYLLFDLGLYRAQERHAEAFVRAEREGDLTAWLAHFSGVVRLVYEDGIRRFLLHQQADGSLNERQWRVAEWFARRDRDAPGRRVRFSEVRTAFPEVPERTLQRDLATLRDCSILTMEGKWKGARYVFSAAIEVR